MSEKQAISPEATGPAKVETNNGIPAIQTEPMQEVANPVPPVAPPPPPTTLSAPTSHPVIDPKLSLEDKILAFLNGRTGSFVKINDFLKSLYSVPKLGETPWFANQQKNKSLRRTLQKLQAEGKVEFANNTFEKLGTHYYDTNDVEQKTKYHTIANLPIEAKIPQ